MNIYKVIIPEEEWQMYTGEVKFVEALIELDPQLVKEITNTSNGLIYFATKSDDTITLRTKIVKYPLDSILQKAIDSLKSKIKNFALEQIKAGNYQKRAFEVKITKTLTKNDIDLEFLKEVMNEFYNEKKKLDEEEAKRKELKRQLNEIIKELNTKGATVDVYSSRIEIRYKTYKHEIPVKDLEDAINKLRNINLQELLIEKLTEDKKKLQEELTELKEKYKALCEFIKEGNYEQSFLEFMKNKRLSEEEKDLIDEITEDFMEIFEEDC